ncbi:MAG: PorP/SprF family type IX secretion system membrane protein [Saprospiraceae bacterium]|nr:PorP/SprF family type IX secretion system membrane protein [Saprospiraceae bacterium]
MLSILVLTFTLAGLKAQDEGIFSHYIITPILINPSVAGFNDLHQIQFNARAQWTGFQDAPKSIGAVYNGPIGNTFGLGLMLLGESAAQLTRVRAQMDFAFRFDVSDDFKMAAGFAAELEHVSITEEATSDVFFQGGDIVVANAADGYQIFDASVGMFGLYKQATFFGITFANLVQARLDDIVDTSTDGALFEYFLAHAGHRFDFEAQNFNIEPSVLVKQLQYSPFEVDVNLKAGFMDDSLVAGLTYGSLGSLGILLGTRMENLQLFYSYDVSFQRFQKFNSGSHEIMVAVELARKDGLPRRRR